MKKYIIGKKEIIKVLNKNKFKLKNYRMYDGENGIINTIYFITTTNNKQIVLKIINPLKKWKERKTINEVQVINFISKNTTVPVPKILDYSVNSNLIGYEYILMTRIKGEPLSKTYKEINNIQRIKYVKEIANYLVQINNFRFNKIGNFDKDMQLTKLVDVGKGPFEYYSTYIYFAIKRYLPGINKQKFKKEIDAFTYFNEKIIKELNIVTDYALCHFDLSTTNVLVYNNKVSGFIDFEWSGSYPIFEELVMIQDDFKFNKYKDCKKEFFKILNKHKINNRVSKKFRLISDMMFSAMSLSEYKNWFKDELEAEKFSKSICADIKKLIKNYDDL